MTDKQQAYSGCLPLGYITQCIMLVWFSLLVIAVSDTENKFQKEEFMVSDKE